MVRSAIEAGVDLATVNVMAMDYGCWATPGPDGQMGRYAIDVACAVNLGLLSMWSATRDVPCPDEPSPWASPTCSGINQTPGEFATTLRGA